MALTETLDDVGTTGINIVNPTGGGGGFLRSLSRFGSGLSELAGQSYAQSEAKETRSSQNDAAQLAQDTFKDYRTVVESQQPGSVDFDTVPADIMNAARRINRLQQSVRQGRTPETAFQLALESGIDELYRKHPERKAAIAQYFTSQGIDHYLFRDVKSQFEYAENAIKTQREAEDYAYNAAAHAGLFNPQTTSRAEAVLKGQEFLQAQSQFERGRDQINVAKTRAELDEIQRKRINEEGSRNLRQALIRDASIRTNSLAAELSQLTIEAANDPSGQLNTELKKALPAIQQGILTAKASAIAQSYAAGGSKEDADAVGSYYDTILEGVVKAHTGDLSRDSLNVKVLQGMQTQLSIDAARAFPLWNQLTKLDGMANALPLLFGGDPAHQLSKEQQAAIAKELSGWAPASPDGLYHIQRIADVLRGDMKLANLTLPEAQKVIGGVNAAVVGNGTAIIGGDLSPTTTKPFLTGYEQLSDAAFTLTPGVDPKSQLRASNMLSTWDSLNALVKLAKDPNQTGEATQVVISLRATAQKGILTAKAGDWEHGGPTSLLKLVYDEKAGIVKTVIDEDRYRTYLDVTKGTQQVPGVGYSARQLEMQGRIVTPLTREQVLAKGDQALNDRAKTINNYMNVMVHTMQVDPNVPKGLTPRDVRKAAFLGMPLDNATEAQGKNDFAARVQALEQRAADLNLNVVEEEANTENRSRYEPIAHKSADKYGVPREVASFLFGQESGWNAAIGRTRVDANNDGKPDSNASGIAQFIPETARRYGLMGEGFDDRGNAPKAIDAAMHYLSDLYKKFGNWEQALEAYGVTARANFKTEEAYQSVLSRARQAVGLGGNG